MSEALRPFADAMFAAAADVLATLAGRAVTAAASTASAGTASLRVEPSEVATVTRVPGADLTFSARFAAPDFGRVVEWMLGTGGDGSSLDAMALSIVNETVTQLSTAMGERLAAEAGRPADGITTSVADEASAFPAPPFATFAAALDLGEGYSTTVVLDFDVLAQHRLAPAPQPAQPARPAAAPRPAAARPRPERAAEAVPIAFAPLQPTPRVASGANLDLVHDVPVEIAAILGETALSLREVVSMQTGSVFELDKLSTDPVDLYVNDVLIARGEVVVVDDKFAVKISELNPVVDRV